MTKPTRWHYTTRKQLDLILKDGVIRSATARVPKNEIPAVWFSINQHWEETASKSYMDATGTLRFGDMQTTFKVAGLARIGIRDEAAPINWFTYKRTSGILPKEANALVKDARHNPLEWFVSYDPVGRDQWTSVQVFDGAKWKEVPGWRETTAAAVEFQPVKGGSAQ